MNSFTLMAVGNVARDPERGTHADGSYTRLCLVGNDTAGRDAQGNPIETVTSAWFVAFGKLGEALARNVRTGDQLIVQAQLRNNTWTDRAGKRRFEPSFVIQQFRFGAPGRATRQVLAARESHVALATSF